MPNRDLERRDPRLATRMIQFLGRGIPQVPKWRAEEAIETGYKASWIVNTCVNIIAETLASLPFRVGADPGNPTDFDAKHPMARLLGPATDATSFPNRNVSAEQLWKTAIINYLVTGRFAWEIDFGPRDIPAGLYQLVMGRFDPIASDGGLEYFTGYRYRIAGNGGVDYDTYDLKDVVYVYSPDPTDPRQAFSDLQGSMINTSVVLQLDRYHYGFVANDARPAQMIIHSPFATSADEAVWKNQFLAEHRGPENAGKTAFLRADTDDGDLSGIIDIKTLGVSNRDSQITAIYLQQLQAITAQLRVPMSMFDASGRTFDNAEHEVIGFYRRRIMPLARDLASAVNRELSGLFPGGNIGWFDFSNVEELKPKAPGNMVIPVTDFTRNERRAFTGYGPADEEKLDAENRDALAEGGYTGKADEPAPVPPALPVSAPAQTDDTPTTPPKLVAIEGGRRAGELFAAEVRAAARPTGTMVALYPTKEQAKALKLKGRDAEKARDLHVTLAYLPDFDQADLPVLHQEVARFAAQMKTVSAKVSGKGEFVGGDKPVTYASVDAPGLSEQRALLVKRLTRAGLNVADEHGFTPHITLSYSQRPDDNVQPMDLSFDHVRVAHGDAHAHFPMAKAAPTVDEVAAAARAQVVDAIAAPLAATLARHDERMMISMAGRERRAKKALGNGESVVDALLDSYWPEETRAQLTPLVLLTGALVRQTLGEQATDHSLEIWTEGRVARLADQLLSQRRARLEASTSEGIGDLIADAFSTPALDVRAVAGELFDSAVNAVGGVPVDHLKSLLARIAVGDVDWDAATLELTA